MQVYVITTYANNDQMSRNVFDATDVSLDEANAIADAICDDFSADRYDVELLDVDRVTKVK